MSVRLMHGDTVEQMRTLPSESFDAVVTDPPAGIAFMGRSWDHDKGGRRQWVAWMTEVFTEVYRVMKPGAHGLVWALPRTSHWTAWALEDAGFEVRDAIVHLTGQGFPKSLDISRAIDKAAGAEREVVGIKSTIPERPITANWKKSAVNKESIAFGAGAGNIVAVTAPATPEAAQWAGWGTALKPAAEIWWLIRKPLSESTIAANVLKHGTGALNIDAARIGLEGKQEHWDRYSPSSKIGYRGGAGDREGEAYNPAGRWPPNVAISHNGPDENGEGGCQEVGTRAIRC